MVAKVPLQSLSGELHHLYFDLKTSCYLWLFAFVNINNLLLVLAHDSSQLRSSKNGAYNPVSAEPPQQTHLAVFLQAHGITITDSIRPWLMRPITWLVSTATCKCMLSLSCLSRQLSPWEEQSTDESCPCVNQVRLVYTLQQQWERECVEVGNVLRIQCNDRRGTLSA